MTDDDLVTAALDAEEAFEECSRRFRIATHGGIITRVVEYPADPTAPVDFGSVKVDATLKYWDLGDETMAKDFIRLQCWKAATRRLLNIQQRKSVGALELRDERGE